MAEYVAKNVVDRAFANLVGGVPWNVHAEWPVGGSVARDRLVAAAEATMREHPLLNARDGGDDAWCIPDAPPRPVVGFHRATTGDGLADLRGTVVSRRFELWHEAPVRFDVLRGASGDHVVVVADHALVDGVGIGRTVVSLITGYALGRRGPVDQRWRGAHALQAATPPARRGQETLQTLSDRAVPTAVRLAREHVDAVEGYGVAYHEASPAVAEALASLRPGPSTRNDVVVAAVCVVGMAWNRSRGMATVPFSVGVPLNLRPARGWFDAVCNATIPWPVRIEDERPAEVLGQVSDQLRPVRAGLYSTDVRAVLGYMAGRRGLPVRVRHGLATTTVVSTVPGADALRADGLAEVPAVGLQGGAPAPPSMGMTFAVVPDRGAYRFSARFLRSHHSAAGATGFLSSVDDTVVRLCRLLHEGTVAR